MGVPSIFPQMTAGEAHEDVLQTCLACGQVQELRAFAFNGIKQRRDGQVGLAHIQAHEAVIMTDRFNSRQGAPCIEGRAIGVATNGELHYVMSAQALDVSALRRRRGLSS